MELKILGKIPLDQLERGRKKKNPEVFALETKNKLKSLVERVNNNFGDILDSDARVKMDNQDDINFLKIKEEAWAQESGISLEEYYLKQEKSKGSLAEMAITLMLDKISSGRLISVRSSKWDDYENGIDNLLLDTETGAVICGLDEVFDDLGQGAKELKEKKVMNKFSNGGAYARYGLKLNLENKKEISIEKLKNLPAFFISLNQNELTEILENIGSKEISESEKNVLRQITGSLKLQLEKMNEIEFKEMPDNFKNNLSRIPQIISYLEEKI